MLRSIIAATSSLCLLSSVSAAALAPSKPSQLADAGTSYQTPCPQVFPDTDVYPIDVINLPDGTTAPFVIPPKQVFVVTAVDIAAQNITAGHSYFLELFRLTPAGGLGTLIVNASGTTPTTGRVGAQLVIPNGSVVKSGTTLCVGTFDGNTGSTTPEVIVHGFFAKDK